MKKQIQILLIILFTTTVAWSQFTSYPYVESISSNIKVESVEITKSNTIISVLMTETKGSLLGPFVYFPSKTLLYCNNEEEGYLIEHLGEHKLDVKYGTVKGNTYRFKLYFPVISPGYEYLTVKSFSTDQYGQTYLWFTWKGIKISNPLKITKTTWTERSLKEYFINNMKDVREGIYERITSNEAKYKLGLVKEDGEFKLIYISSDQVGVLKEGDLKARISFTSSNNLFKANWVMADGAINDNAYVTFSESLMEIVFSDDTEKSVYLKLFPTSEQPTPRVSSSGTGFALSTNGIIVTNFHVIDGASSIKVRGIGGNFNISYNAQILVVDRTNDLAIIQLNDSRFNSVDKIPYTIKPTLSDVGEGVFVLGYPLRATMGDEIKLTNGIISSKTGFQGDITSYQISAPIQPGNSGGPLFDNKGNLIGVVNAKHSGAENVSYAIKVNYLKNLIDLLPTKPVLNTVNSLSSLSLANQVKQLNKLVYIIEVN